ncbi:unnamed protein product [Vicia faba]|uniref:Ribosomal protein S11 n=1 Tax=Vicia faba TaxID=3906 RepID=A0AAV0ZM68_VICFA|nr:unnamed protein product [Vicia faba]
MEKSIPKIGSRKTGRIGSRKHPRKIPKGVIYIKDSFNNTILTVTDVRGRVISWSSAGSYGFKGTRRGTTFVALTAAGNSIQTIVDQGMQQADIMIKGPGLGREAALRVLELLNNSQEDLMKIEHFCVEDLKNILKILQIKKHFV